MSISDVIVVMNAGVVQQIGPPQQVYDAPTNLFVAKFLGTPPINVFDGEAKNGRLLLDGADIMAVRCADGPVTVGIRPEGFIPDEAGPLACSLRAVEVMGRDTSVIAAHPAAQGGAFRAIVSAEQRPDPAAEALRFSLKAEKVHLFAAESGERLEG